MQAPPENWCRHSSTVCCGFTCATYTSSLAIESKSNDAFKSYKSLKTEEELTLSGTPYRIGFYQGTFMPYIDLSDDDRSHQKYSSAGDLVSDTQLSVGSILNSKLTNQGTEDELYVQNNEQTSVLCNRYNDDLLPDTQKDHAAPFTSEVSPQISEFSDSLHPETQLDSIHSPIYPKTVSLTYKPSASNSNSTSSTSLEFSINAQGPDSHIASAKVSHPNALSPLNQSDLAIGVKSTSISNIVEIHEKLSCRERKRIIVPMNRPGNVTKAMKAWIAKIHWHLDPFREDDECWFHPFPPPAYLAPNGSRRQCGKIQKAFTWQDQRGKHILMLNFGMVSKLLFNTLTKQQTDGFINNGFHLSHLCGNWTCLNPAHTTVESGPVNISRNVCFSHRSGCGHSPPCMKDKKVFLNANGKQVDPSLLIPAAKGDPAQVSGSYPDENYSRCGSESDEESLEFDIGERSESMPEITTGDDAGFG